MTTKPRWLRRLGNQRMRQIWDVMVANEAVLPNGEPMTTEAINAGLKQPFSKQQLSNHLSKKPQFTRVGTRRIPESHGTKTYPVALWLADPDAYTPPEHEPHEEGGA